jgi:hypothetical protein
MPTPTWAPFGTTYTFRAPVIGANSVNYSNTWTATAGTVKVIQNGTTLGNINTLPTLVSGQYVYTWTISATEMASDEIVVQTVDRANITDQMFIVSTLPPGSIRSRTVQAGSNNTIVLDTGASATDNIYQGSRIAIIAGTGAGQTRVITQYVGSSRTATVDANTNGTLDTTSVYALFPLGIYGLSNTQIAATVTSALSSYGTSTLTQAQSQTAANSALSAFGASTLTQVQAQAASYAAVGAYGTSTLTQAQAQSAAAGALISYGASTLTQAQSQVAANSALAAYGVSTLTAASIETAVMDKTDGIEIGLTHRGALRLIAAVLLGVRSGTGTGSEVFRSAVSSGKVRVTGTINTTTGDRTAVSVDSTT